MPALSREVSAARERASPHGASLLCTMAGLTSAENGAHTYPILLDKRRPAESAGLSDE